MPLWFILTLAVGLPLLYLVMVGVSFEIFNPHTVDDFNAWAAAILWPVTLPVAIAKVIASVVLNIIR